MLHRELVVQIDCCEDSNVPGLRPFDDGWLVFRSSIACPHFQQNAYFASISDPQSGQALMPGCSFCAQPVAARLVLRLVFAFLHV